LSLITLAESIDTLAAARQAFVSESREFLRVSNLSYLDTLRLADLASHSVLEFSIVDQENNEFERAELTEHYQPYTITIEKAADADGLRIITNTGFSRYLSDGADENTWYVARLKKPILTDGRSILPWDHNGGPSLSDVATKSPRSLVKESASIRIVPQDIRMWLLRSENASLTCSSSLIWIDAALTAGVLCIPEEVDSTSQKLKFKGPPRVSVALRPIVVGDHVSHDSLQQALRWIYELENQAEIRILYFRSELARCGLSQETDLESLLDTLAAALDGAKIAYAMSISELGKDTVKALADLKKSITEDTAKLTEATRQTTAAVAAALAAGFGLLAARVTSNTSINLIGIVMLVVCLYVASVVVSGWNLLRLQQQLRHDWHPKIYRFLTDAEYASLVKKPATTAENAFWWAAALGGGTVATLTVYVCFLWLTS
jgi:hypothetical protein